MDGRETVKSPASAIAGICKNGAAGCGGHQDQRLVGY